MMKIRVRCSYVLDVDVAEGLDHQFMIEENGCPATGDVGAAFDRHVADCEERGVCWACGIQGTNEIIEIVP